MAAPSFRNADEEAQYHLTVLRDGSDAAKIEAREGLAAIFARRGLFAEAAELYELNVRAGVRTPELFEQLSDAYREIGEAAGAEAARAEARRLRAASAEARQPWEASADLTAPEPAASASPAPGASATVQPGEAAPEGRLIQFPQVSSPSVAQPAARSVRGRSATAPALAPDFEPDPLPASLPTRHDGTAPTPLSAASSGQRQRRLPGPLLAVGVVLGLIVLPVVVLALCVINPLSLYLEGRAAGPTVDAREGGQPAEPPRLKVAAGTEASWYLLTGRSVSGLWASPGLELMLEQEIPGVGRSFMVTAPRSQSWGETITIVERRGQGRANQETLVPATFQAPGSLPSSGSVLAGRITGAVQAPRLNETGQFSTTTEAIDLPVQLVVVSGPELWLDRFVNALGMFFVDDRWLLVTIGALLTWCVLAGGSAILLRTRQG